MSLIEILLLAIGLAIDAFSVSLSAGTGEHVGDLRARIRLTFHLGFFQFMMPVIGWFIGMGIAGLIEAVDHWIAFGLLAFIGGRMIQSGLDTESEAETVDPSSGATMVMLSIATSIDALAVGLSLSVLQISIWFPAIVIGVVTFILSFSGVLLGNKLGDRFGKRMEIIGGVILILIGLRILISHMGLFS